MQRGDGKQIGVLVNPAVWKQFRILALNQDKTATELVNEAMTQYLERQGITPADSGGGSAPPPNKGGKGTAAPLKSVKK